ncbi:MAG: hypothetical protein OK454_09490, partial [Thaumarchaeota archaeon]|nr:hypothetical protein [Nitrososphaerota archaeon]
MPKKSSTDAASSSKILVKKSGIRNAMRKGPALNVFSGKETGVSAPSLPDKARKSSLGSALSSATARKDSAQGKPAHLPVPRRTSSAAQIRDAPHARRGVERGHHPERPPENDYREFLMRSPSGSSFISMTGGRRDSIISQTGTISIHSVEGYRPGTPTLMRTDLTAQARPMGRSKSERNIRNLARPEQTLHHRRAKTYKPTPSIYTLDPGGSQTSLVLASCYKPSAFRDYAALDTLRQRGTVEGMFPKAHLLRNITRYMAFSSASYGSSFLKVMGISKEMPLFRTPDDSHHNVRSFAHHTESETNSVLLSSFVDPQGGSDSTGSTNTGLPLIHYISLDHESKAVVLA